MGGKGRGKIGGEAGEVTGVVDVRVFSAITLECLEKFQPNLVQDRTIWGKYIPGTPKRMSLIILVTPKTKFQHYFGDFSLFLHVTLPFPIPRSVLNWHQESHDLV